jgi:hypothetical protein
MRRFAALKSIVTKRVSGIHDAVIVAVRAGFVAAVNCVPLKEPIVIRTDCAVPLAVEWARKLIAFR